MTAKERLSSATQSPTAEACRPLRASSPAIKPKGAVLVVVLVCLMIAGMMASSLLRTAVGQRLIVQRQKRELQAMWLAESGLERGAARLAAEANYTGETWQAPADELGGRDAGAVEIRVEPIADQPAARMITAQADYPAAADSRARKTLQARVTLTSAGERP